MNSINDMEYIERRNSVFAKFTPEFQRTIHLRPRDNAVVESLIIGADPFRLLEDCLNVIWQQGEQIQALALRQPPAPITIHATPEQLKELMRAFKDQRNNPAPEA